MNAISVALLWCVVQITLVVLAAGGVYLVVRRWRPDAATPAVPSGLAKRG